MSYSKVIKHIEKILNQCGDPVRLIPTGQKTMSETGNMSIEINKAQIQRQNKCFQIPSPSPNCNSNPEDTYWINRIRISPSTADDYSKNYPFTDEEIQDIISTKTTLFGYY